MSICLQLDLGNSSAKWRLVESSAVLARGIYVPGDDAAAEQLLHCTEAPDDIWVSSVAAAEGEQALVALLQQRWSVTPWFARTQAVTGDLVNSYEDPSRMGADRWLAMLGARARTSSRCCVVDVGSALTIDFIAADGRHEGGYIIPGPNLMERALLLDTDRVRFDEAVEYGLAPGISTAEAVRHGITLAQVGSVALALERFADDDTALFFCGGAGEAVMQSLQRDAVHAPDLVFEGLDVMASGARQVSR